MAVARILALSEDCYFASADRRFAFPMHLRRAVNNSNVNYRRSKTSQRIVGKKFLKTRGLLHLEGLETRSCFLFNS
jgi:hypothetical protein